MTISPRNGSGATTTATVFSANLQLEPFGDLIRFGSDSIGFERQIEAAIREDDPGIVERRRDFARRNSWDARAAVFEELISSLGVRKTPRPARAAEHGKD